MKTYLWLAVTADEYELPIAVEESASKLAKTLGVSTGTILKKSSGKINGRKIVKIDIEKGAEVGEIVQLHN